MVQWKDGINSIASCHSLSHHKFRWLQYHFLCAFFSHYWRYKKKKKKHFPQLNLFDAVSPEDGLFPPLLVDRDCVHTAGWIILPPQSKSWLDFFAICGLFFFFLLFSQPFPSPLRKESYRGLTSSVNALDMLDDESSFSSQTQCIFSHPLKRWISDEATQPRIATSLPPESWTVSLFSRPRFTTWCLYSSRKKGLVYHGKSYPLTEEISE